MTEKFCGESKFFISLHCTELWCAQWGNYENSLSHHIFYKNFVKAMVLLLKKLLYRLVDLTNFFQWERKCRFSTLCGMHSVVILQISPHFLNFPWNWFLEFYPLLPFQNWCFQAYRRISWRQSLNINSSLGFKRVVYPLKDFKYVV